MKSAIYVVTLTLLGAAAGCEVTADKIDGWKKEEFGPRKIRAALRDSRVSAKVRGRALLALAELNFHQSLKIDLDSLDEKDRETLFESLAKGMLADLAPASSLGLESQQASKDLLFSLRGFMPPAIQARADSALVDWILADWSKRQAGRHSALKILRAIGASAATAAAGKLTSDPAAMLLLAKFIAKSGSDKDRDVATDSLKAYAAKNKANPAAAYEALGRLARPTGRQYLLQQAQQGSEKQRQYALLALALHPHASLAVPVAAIAADGTRAAETRDAAFDILEKIDDPKVADQLAAILVKAKGRLRYVTASAMVKCCKAYGVTKLLEVLPKRYGYEKRDVVLYIEREILDLGKVALAPLRKLLTPRGLMTSSWIARTIAVRVLGAAGEAKDLPAIQTLVGDFTTLRGWGERGTVGTEARGAVKKLKSRLPGSG